MNPPLESIGSSQRLRSIGLVVVHGIGEPTAGEALADFTDSLEKAKLASFDPDQPVKRLIAPTESTSIRTAFFPAHLRRGKTPDGASIAAAEVYWGSASQLAPGRLGVLHGIVSLMLNVPALVAGADERKAETSGALQKQAWLISMLLAGPAFSLNALLLATLAVHLVIHYLFDAPSAAAEAAVPLLAIVVTSGLGFLPWFWFPETRWSLWLVGPITLAITAVTRGVGNIPVFTDTTALTLEWLIGGVVALLLLIVGTYIVGRISRRVERPSTTALLAVCLQFGFWVAFVPLTWQLVLNWMPAKAHEPWMDALFGRAVKSDGVQWLMTGVVVLMLGIVVIWREIAQRAETRKGGSRPAPRLIVNALVATAMVAVTALGAVVILHGTLNLAPPWIVRLYALVPNTHGTTALLVVFPLLVTQIRLGLDLAHDVISYIYYECERGRPVLRLRRGTGTRSVTPVRSRFHAVVDYLVKDARVERLVIIAHSQGTVIALDELTHGWAPGELPPGISFVTVGSPISHLYGHYFPNIYRAWDHERWDVFFGQVSRWANFYRLGDYVGTTIEPPQRCEFHQEALGRGAHTHYLRDPRLLTALERWGIFAERSGRKRDVA